MALQFGEITVSNVPEWSGHLLTRDQLVPQSARADWESNKSWLVPDFWDPESEDAWMVSQTFVLKTSNHTVVIDTGVGNGKSRPFLPQWSGLQSDYLERLAAEVDPTSVDLVVVTHVHPDHVGWNTRLIDDAWVPTFPNATYLLPALDVKREGPVEEDSPAALVFADSEVFSPGIAA